MTIDKFRKSSEVEQLSVIVRLGYQIASLKHKEQIIELYKVKDFYVQLHYLKPFRELKVIESLPCVEQVHPELRRLVAIQ